MWTRPDTKRGGRGGGENGGERVRLDWSAGGNGASIHVDRWRREGRSRTRYDSGWNLRPTALRRTEWSGFHIRYLLMMMKTIAYAPACGVSPTSRELWRYGEQSRYLGLTGEVNRPVVSWVTSNDHGQDRHGLQSTGSVPPPRRPNVLT